MATEQYPGMEGTQNVVFGQINGFCGFAFRSPVLTSFGDRRRLHVDPREPFCDASRFIWFVELMYFLLYEPTFPSSTEEFIWPMSP